MPKTQRLDQAHLDAAGRGLVYLQLFSQLKKYLIETKMCQDTFMKLQSRLQRLSRVGGRQVSSQLHNTVRQITALDNKFKSDDTKTGTHCTNIIQSEILRGKSAVIKQRTCAVSCSLSSCDLHTVLTTKSNSMLTTTNHTTTSFYDQRNLLLLFSKETRYPQPSSCLRDSGSTLRHPVKPSSNQMQQGEFGRKSLLRDTTAPSVVKRNVKTICETIE